MREQMMRFPDGLRGAKKYRVRGLRVYPTQANQSKPSERGEPVYILTGNKALSTTISADLAKVSTPESEGDEAE